MPRIVVTVAAIVLLVFAPAGPAHADEPGAAPKLKVLCDLAKALGLELPDCEKKVTGPSR